MRYYDRTVNGYLTATQPPPLRQNNRMAMKEILERISQRSKELVISENALSQRAGLSRDGIRNWRRRVERGEEAAGATVNALAGVAAVLGVSETWLIKDLDESLTNNHVKEFHVINGPKKYILTCLAS